MPSYCLSTTTPGYPVYVNGSTTLPVTDGLGNVYQATTSCPAVVAYTVNEINNPAQDLYMGIFLMLACFFFVVWYFMTRFRMG